MNLLSCYEELLALAEKDPEAFEKRSLEIFEEYFNSLPEEKALKARRAQWRLNAELGKAKNNIERYNRMVSIFYKGLAEFNDALNGNIPKQVENNVEIIPFKHK